MNDNPDFANARDVLAVWKAEPLRQYTKALLKAGLAELAAGRTYFGADNVEMDTTGSGTAGTVTRQLMAAHIITPCYIHRPEEGIIHGRRKSKREKARSRTIPLYTLNRGLSEAWLAKHGKSFVARQIDMFVQAVGE